MPPKSFNYEGWISNVRDLRQLLDDTSGEQGYTDSSLELLRELDRQVCWLKDSVTRLSYKVHKVRAARLAEEQAKPKTVVSVEGLRAYLQARENDQIARDWQSMDAHWDPESKRWWMGKTKYAAMEAAKADGASCRPGTNGTTHAAVAQVPEKKEQQDKVRPGLVEVIYGEHKGIAPGQGRTGYAYYSDIKGLEVGDVVDVPGTFSSYDQYATVVRLESSYQGSAKHIVKLVRKAAEVK